jgi:hypothetical protein
MQSHRGDGTIGPRGGEGQPNGRCRDLGTIGRVLGLAAAIQRQPAAGQQLEPVRPPAARDERQVRTTGAAEEQLDGSVRLRGLEQDAGEPRRSPCGDETSVEVAGELEALVSGGECDVQLADREGDNGPVEEVAGKSWRRPEQTSGLDGARDACPDLEVFAEAVRSALDDLAGPVLGGPWSAEQSVIVAAIGEGR